MSTAMPTSPIASSTSRPSWVSGLLPNSGVEVPPSSLFARCVSDMKRTPRSNSVATRSTCPSMACPPSMPSTAEMRPSARFASRCAALPAMEATPSDSRQKCARRSIWKVVRVHSDLRAWAGHRWRRANRPKPSSTGRPRVTMVKHCSFTPASLSRGKSTCPSAEACVRSRFHINESACPSATATRRCRASMSTCSVTTRSCRVPREGTQPMQIDLNGEPRDVPDGVTVTGLLELLPSRRRAWPSRSTRTSSPRSATPRRR